MERDLCSAGGADDVLWQHEAARQVVAHDGSRLHIRLEDIRGAAVIHFNGEPEAMADVVFNQCKQLWS